MHRKVLAPATDPATVSERWSGETIDCPEARPDGRILADVGVTRRVGPDVMSNGLDTGLQASSYPRSRALIIPGCFNAGSLK